MAALVQRVARHTTHVQEPAAKTDEQQMDQVLGLLFENDLEVRNAQVAGDIPKLYPRTTVRPT